MSNVLFILFKIYDKRNLFEGEWDLKLLVITKFQNFGLLRNNFFIVLIISKYFN
jgi:hypothetical protein